MSTFADLGVSAPVCEALASRNLHAPFEIQSMVMSDALAGKDVLAKSRTGSGKTLAFAIPIVERVKPGGARPKVLVLVPTRELCVQVTDEGPVSAGARCSGSGSGAGCGCACSSRSCNWSEATCCCKPNPYL